jgi:2-oxoglutarate ferredoxin oxidoreductase subunit alpha
MEREHNIVNSLFLQPDALEKSNNERFERYKYIEENEAMYEEYMMDDAEICIAAFGIASRVAKNAIVEARKKGIKVGMIRPITLWPFPNKPFEATIGKIKKYISVELSMGQMIDDVRLATGCKVPVSLCNRVGGMIPSPEQVLEAIKNANKNGGAK